MLPRKFFERDVVVLAKALLGCELVHESLDGITSGIIVETEAYHESDEASHSFKSRTKRIEVMFGPGGHVYVYFTYGMHWCFNVTADKKGVGAAVLIRALEPSEGIEIMKKRRGFSQSTHLSAMQGNNEQRAKRTIEYDERGAQADDAAVPQKLVGVAGPAGHHDKALRGLCDGPAKLVQAMGISKSDYGKSLYEAGLYIKKPALKKFEIASGPRIGISKAKYKPWRFWIKDNPFISR